MAELRRMARALSRGGNGPWVANRTALRSTTSTPVHLVEVPPPHRRALGIEDDVEGVLDILGAERGPVVELDVTPEVEDVRRHVGQVPALGERGTILRPESKAVSLVAVLESLARGEVSSW